VPTYQQSLQGNCNGLLGSVEQNVAYDATDPSKQDWKRWNLDARQWLEGDAPWNPPVKDANYPEWAPGTSQSGFPPRFQRMGYNTVKHHRRYTVSLVDTSSNLPSAPSDFISQPFTRAEWRTGSRPGKTPKIIDKGDVMCVVSTQHSPMHRIADPSSALGFNGYCWNGELKDGEKWQGVEVFVGCQVYFGAPGTRKRGEILGAMRVPGAPIIEVRASRRTNASLSDLAASAECRSHADAKPIHIDGLHGGGQRSS
jgi:hypothetical protein